MSNAKLIFDQKLRFLEGRLEARIKAYEVPKSRKFPDGVKLSCVLLDLEEAVPRLLLDNHEPYGYHLHTKMPYDKTHRVQIKVTNVEQAIEYFMIEVRKVIKNEI